MACRRASAEAADAWWLPAKEASKRAAAEEAAKAAQLVSLALVDEGLCQGHVVLQGARDDTWVRVWRQAEEMARMKKENDKKAKAERRRLRELGAVQRGPCAPCAHAQVFPILSSVQTRRAHLALIALGGG